MTGLLTSKVEWFGALRARTVPCGPPVGCMPDWLCLGSRHNTALQQPAILHSNTTATATTATPCARRNIHQHKAFRKIVYTHNTHSYQPFGMWNRKVLSVTLCQFYFLSIQS